VSLKPEWLKTKPPAGETYLRIKRLKENLGLSTVCEEAHCPNIHECWGGGTATFMILGDICTRHCRFCAVKSGRPQSYTDPFEPVKVAYAIKQMGLRYVVVTSVDRDDLEDSGATHFASTIAEIRRLSPGTSIEVLIPDFAGRIDSLQTVVYAHPDVIAHNVETVSRLTPIVRDPRASYKRSLDVLDAVKHLDGTVLTKSSIMLGLGEQEEEVITTLTDLAEKGVDIVTIGQYLQPSKGHLPVVEYVHPSKFEYYRKKAQEIGFRYVASGPFVRSSYRAGEVLLGAIAKQA